MDDEEIREYSSLMRNGSLSDRWQSMSTGLKVALFAIVVISAIALTFFIATIVLATQSSSDKTVTIPCPTPAPAEDSNNDFPFGPIEQWDISANHSRLLTFSTSEGTWLNLDLSPDGTQMVFDLLGDLYLLPIGGGNAQLLRGGVPFETQPRFSPDGKHILFTSDASGCDNLWVIEVANPSVATQVTREPFHSVTDGAWTPDGNSIVAVKWFTSTRSIPAGEIWKFPASGAEKDGGVRLVGRVSPTSQVGPQEPIVSPDGRYVYYSQNVMDSTYWNYNKDPHNQIFAIFRLDLQTNATTTVAGGDGGAARPILSKNGKHLAFIRRRMYNTSLVMKDLPTGNEVILLAGASLSFDQQESSSPCGVYPFFSWTNDNSAILIWGAEGKFVRVDTLSGKGTTVDMNVDVKLDLAPTVRTSVDLSDSALPFAVKAVNWVSTYTNGNTQVIAYTAVGRTYVTSMPGGTPFVVKEPGESYQFGPSISADGRRLVHIIWNDNTLSIMQVLTYSEPINGKPQSFSVTNVTLGTGRYSNAQFSPVDSNKIVYTRLGGDTLSGNSYSNNPGVYIVTRQEDDSWKTELITADGGWPQWSSDGKYVYVVKGGYPLQLVKFPADQGAEPAGAVVVESKYATYFSISPDQKWVAFIEFNQLFAAPFALGSDGKPLQVSSRPGYQPSGLVRVSQIGAYYVHWTKKDPNKDWALGWLLGSEYSQAYGSDILPKCQGSGASYSDCVKGATVTYDLSFKVKEGVAVVTMCFDNATIATMKTPTDVINQGRIVVTNDRITAVGPMSSVTCPQQATVFNVQGGVILPGFIDVHAHWSGRSEFYVQQSWEFIENLVYGVTTVHNPSLDTIWGATDQELVRASRKTGPRIFSTGEILYGAGGPYHCEIGTYNDAYEALQRLKAYGGWSAKSYSQPCRRSRQQILQAARDLKMDVVPEGGMHFYWNLNEIIDGHTTIEHSIPMAPLFNDVITLFAKSGTGYTPTLIVNYGGLMGENYWYQTENVWEEPRVYDYSPQMPLMARSMRRPKAEDQDYHHFATSKSAFAIMQAGGLVEAGAHGQRQGVGFHWELEMLAQGGMSPQQALYAGTMAGARALGLTKDLGTIEVGKLGDLIIYDPADNPLTSIANSRKVKLVTKSGFLWEAATMQELLPVQKPLPPGPQLNTPLRG